MNEIIRKLAPTPFASVRRAELLGNVIEDGQLLESFARSLTEAAWRGEVYPARALAVESRKVLLELMRNTLEAQELEGALRAAEEGGGA